MPAALSQATVEGGPSSGPHPCLPFLGHLRHLGGVCCQEAAAALGGQDSRLHTSGLGPGPRELLIKAVRVSPRAGEWQSHSGNACGLTTGQRSFHTLCIIRASVRLAFYFYNTREFDPKTHHLQLPSEHILSRGSQRISACLSCSALGAWVPARPLRPRKPWACQGHRPRPGRPQVEQTLGMGFGDWNS